MLRAAIRYRVYWSWKHCFTLCQRIPDPPVSRLSLVALIASASVIANVMLGHRVWASGCCRLWYLQPRSYVIWKRCQSIIHLRICGHFTTPSVSNVDTEPPRGCLPVLDEFQSCSVLDTGLPISCFLSLVLVALFGYASCYYCLVLRIHLIHSTFEPGLDGKIIMSTESLGI